MTEAEKAERDKALKAKLEALKQSKMKSKSPGAVSTPQQPLATKETKRIVRSGSIKPLNDGSGNVQSPSIKAHKKKSGGMQGETAPSPASEIKIAGAGKKIVRQLNIQKDNSI